MTDQMSKHDATLFSLVMSLQSMAMVQLGKLANPQTGQVEADLDGARGTIDILDMLKVKCRDNTHDELVKMLDQMVMELQMNFLDERNRGSGEERRPTNLRPTNLRADEPAADEPAADEPAAER